MGVQLSTTTELLVFGFGDGGGGGGKFFVLLGFVFPHARGQRVVFGGSRQRRIPFEKIRFWHPMHMVFGRRRGVRIMFLVGMCMTHFFLLGLYKSEWFVKQNETQEMTG